MFISLIETLFQLIFFAPLGVGVNEENQFIPLGVGVNEEPTTPSGGARRSQNQSVNFGRHSNYIDIQIILNFIILLLFS